jgi:hypothetical protein
VCEDTNNESAGGHGDFRQIQPGKSLSEKSRLYLAEFRRRVKLSRDYRSMGWHDEYIALVLHLGDALNPEIRSILIPAESNFRRRGGNRRMFQEALTQRLVVYGLNEEFFSKLEKVGFYDHELSVQRQLASYASEFNGA